MASGLIQAVDDMDGPWVNPDCWAGKHTACARDAWDQVHDEPTACQCRCHGEYDPEDWDEDDSPQVVDVPTGGYL
jgi:hypothetical protein